MQDDDCPHEIIYDSLCTKCLKTIVNNENIERGSKITISKDLAQKIEKLNKIYKRSGHKSIQVRHKINVYIH